MLLIKNIGLLATPLGNAPACGNAQGELRLLSGAAIAVQDGVITGVYESGAASKVLEDADQILDAQGRLVTPGLVDCHTHLVFGGWRQHEVPLKLRGASYLEILRSGGGILDTVRQTRAMTENALYEKSMGFLDEMLALGVTTVESKSGYGLSLKEELKQLRVNQRLQRTHRTDVVSTFLGAHAVPEEYQGNPDGYVELIVNTMLPLIAQERLAEFCDVFCETGVFSVAQSRAILSEAQKLGLGLKLHADEIDAIGGAVLAGTLRAVSAEHLIATDAAGIQAMAAGGVIADLLPATSFYLGKTYAPAREMITQEIPVAVASDFNPGSCPGLNLQLAMNLAYLRYRMTPEEILTAVTLNAACSLHRGGLIGTVEPGKQADLIVWDCEDLQTIVYRFGSNLVKTVIKKGCIV